MLNQMDPANKINITKITTPYCLRKFLKFINLSDKKLNKIQEPSNGGTGIKLKIANQIFISTIKSKILNLVFAI